MMTSNPVARPLDGLRYGLLGLPLAFCALPLYVVMPHFYATQWGVSLTALGALLLALRLLDAVLDPWIGRWCDAWAQRSATVLWRAMAMASVVLAIAFAALFNPQVAPEQALVWAAVSLGLTYLAYSVVTVGHQSGNAFQWGYTLALPVDGRVIEVQFDDWMFLMDERVMLNRAAMSKWGLHLGDVTLSFVKRKN